jgi:uncharacterized membrane protein YvbJ
MPYCPHCGELAEGRRYCTACGAPVAPDAVVAMAAEIRRHRMEMRLIAAALGLVFLVSAGLVVNHSKRSGQGSELLPPCSSRWLLPL